MNNLLLSTGQIAFLIIVPTVVIALAVLVIVLVIRHKNEQKDFKMHYYKRIYKIAMDKDYYLINNFLFKIDDSHVGRIDHILFADKYIYIINDFFYDGNIVGKENDSDIICINKYGQKSYQENPLGTNKKLLTRLSLVTGIDKTLLIGVSLINDNCECGVTSSSKSFYIIQSKHINKLIKAIESRQIGNINKEQLASAVKAIDKLNRRKRYAEQK